MAICDGVRNMWMPLAAVVLLLYGTGLILYINATSGKSKRTRIRTPLGRDQNGMVCIHTFSVYQ